MTEVFQQNQSSCPINCCYCVITKVKSRRQMWNEKTLIGLNKAVTIFNPPPDKTDIKAMREFYDFPLELFRSDIVGFNAISDPFWPKYQTELDYFLDKVAPIAKLVVCVTKFNPPDDVLQKLAVIPNFRLNVSITGLDGLETTKTRDRLNLLARAKKYKISAFPIVHPYIAGLSDLSFLPRLKELGYGQIDFKGLRYCHDSMAEWMPIESQKYYIGTNGEEILPEDGWREKIEAAGLKLKSLKEWYKESLKDGPKSKMESAKKNVLAILPFANITSSDSDEAVIEAAINRRL